MKKKLLIVLVVLLAFLAILIDRWMAREENLFWTVTCEKGKATYAVREDGKIATNEELEFLTKNYCELIEKGPIKR